MKKGFTLVELLAVIVILAIIALIAVPIIMNIVESSRKGAAKSSAYGYIDGVEIFYSKSILSGGEFTLDGTFSVDETGKLNGNTIEVSGTKPSGGYLTYSNGRVTSGCLTIDGYKVTIENDEATNAEKGTCETPTYTVYANGTAVYFNPDEGVNSICNNYTEPNSKKENNTGCMKWYIFNDNETSSTIKMILDHNTTEIVAWNESGDNSGGPVTVLAALNEDTANWEESLNVELITADEVAQIIGQTLNNSGIDNLPSWLYDNTGWPSSGTGNSGYWTSTAYAGDSSNAWFVHYFGFLDNYFNVDYDDDSSGFGARPVITISKSLLSQMD